MRKMLHAHAAAVLPWEGKIAGYVTNKLEMWRYEPLYTRDDMMQEAYIVWLKCADRYQDVVSKHFMALFKTAWERRCIDLAYKATECRQQISITFGGKYGDDEELQQMAAEPIGDDENAGYGNTLIRQVVTNAPSEVRDVFTLLLNAPAELLELAQSALGRRRKNDVNLLAARCLGLSDDAKPVDEAKAYVQQTLR